MTTAFVLSGGGSLGAVQVGMLEALDRHDVRPDLVVGTSVGALNAAYVAGRGTGAASLAGLAASWAGVRRGDVFPLGVGRLLRTRGGGALCSDAGLRRLVASHLSFERLEDAPLRLCVVATDLLSGREVAMVEGDAASAVLASTAIPGVLPAVVREGRTLVDGGLANNTAISQAVALGADRVVVLPAGHACALSQAPKGPLGSAMQAISVLTQQRLVSDMETYAGRVELLVVPPPCPVGVSPIDFAHSVELIERGREQAQAWIAGGGLDGVGVPITLHHHAR